MSHFSKHSAHTDVDFTYPQHIQFPPALQPGDKVAVTAPSSGVPTQLHHLVHDMRDYLTSLGYEPVIGTSVWTDDKCVSIPKKERAAELQQFLLDPQIKAIIPPWGGEFLMELLPLLDWEQIRTLPPKWILGFSDTSTLTFVYTLYTGYASAHGPSGVDIARADDETTSRWHDLLTAVAGQPVEQQSSAHYQATSDFSKPGFKLDAPTRWEILGQEQEKQAQINVSGRLLGGCLDVLSPLTGTVWAPVPSFIERYGQEDGIIWYLESCEMNAADIYRHLWQLQQNGWFQHTRAVLIGRPDGYAPVKNFKLIDALHSAFDELDFPVIYNVDIGHIPPQVTLINGAKAELTVTDGKGTIVQTLI